MKFVRTAYQRTKEVYEMEITEQLAQEVEDAIKRELADPATMPIYLSRLWYSVGNAMVLIV